MNVLASIKKGKWELTFLQVVSTSCVLALLLLSTYVVGFRTGRQRGVIHALDSSEMYLAKLPVEVASVKPEDLDEVSSDIYAKLSLEPYKSQKVDTKNPDGTDVAPLSGNEDVKKPQRPISDRLGLERGATKTSAEVKGTEVVGETSKKESLLPPSSSVIPTIEQADLSKGWFVQVAAPASEADATSLSNKLKSSGFQVLIERAKVQERTYYRILVGPEATRITSERLLQQLLREKYIDKAPFIRQVK
jgi:cell division septation protein DedD